MKVSRRHDGNSHALRILKGSAGVVRKCLSNESRRGDTTACHARLLWNIEVNYLQEGSDSLLGGIV